jgi:hypothetical protein
MLQIVRYTAIRTPKNKLAPRGEGEVISTVPGDPDKQLQTMAEILFSRVFNPDGSLRSLPGGEGR